MTGSTGSELADLHAEAERNHRAGALAAAEAEVRILELKLQQVEPRMAWTTITPDLPRPHKGQDALSYQLAVEAARTTYLAARYAIVRERAERAAQRRKRTAAGISAFLPAGPYTLADLIEAAKTAQREAAHPTLAQQRQAAEAERTRRRHAAELQATQLKEVRHDGR